MTQSTPHQAVPDRLQSLDELALALRRFAAERDWEAYHTPKNLAAALIVEAAESLHQSFRVDRADLIEDDLPGLAFKPTGATCGVIATAVRHRRHDKGAQVAVHLIW